MDSENLAWLGSMGVEALYSLYSTVLRPSSLIKTLRGMAVSWAVLEAYF